MRSTAATSGHLRISAVKFIQGKLRVHPAVKLLFLDCSTVRETSVRIYVDLSLTLETISRGGIHAKLICDVTLWKWMELNIRDSAHDCCKEERYRKANIESTNKGDLSRITRYRFICHSLIKTSVIQDYITCFKYTFWFLREKNGRRMIKMYNKK